MVQIHPFAALRPDPRLAPGVASVPYDVITAAEASECIRRNPHSFLRVSRADAELPGTPPHADAVYRRARENLVSMVRDGILRRDESPSLYLYRVGDGSTWVTGLVCTVGVDDYLDGTVRRHELTRRDKEEDRTRHIDAVNAQTGLVFLFYRDDRGIAGEVEALVPSREGPDTTVKAENGTIHQVFRIGDTERMDRAIRLFSPLRRLYIADGHHRAASAVNIALARRREGRVGGESGRFMAVIIPHQQVKIHGYSRLVTDLAGHSPSSFLALLSGRFKVQPDEPEDRGGGNHRAIPSRALRLFRMYLDGTWYTVGRERDPGVPEPVPVPDVQILQEEILSPLLGIGDPRNDPRLQFLGGSDPLLRLEARVDGGEFAVAFAMEPVGIEEVMAVADAGRTMPPKSTWFEPKLRSGLLVHTLD